MEKIVSQLDHAGYFLGPVVADESPLEPGVFLIPAGAVDKVPPVKIEQGRRYRPWGAGWRGEDLPAPAAQAERPEPSAADLRRAEIFGRLAGIDAESIRPAREISMALADGGLVPAVAVTKLAALEEEAAGLRLELAAL